MAGYVRKLEGSSSTRVRDVNVTRAARIDPSPGRAQRIVGDIPGIPTDGLRAPILDPPDGLLRGGSEDAVRVVIVDPRPLFVLGICALLPHLEKDFTVVGATTVPEAIAQVGAQTAGLAVIGIGGREDVDGLRQIRSALPEAKLLVLSDVFDPRIVREALTMGVSGYLSRVINAQDLVAAFHAIRRGEVVLSPLASVCLVRTEDSELPTLSDCELDVLRMIVEGLELSEIAERMFVSKSTVKRTVQSVLDKLQVQNRLQAAVYAVRAGLI